MRKDKEELLNKIVKENLNSDSYEPYRILVDEYEQILEPVYLNNCYEEPSPEKLNFFDLNQTIDICYGYLNAFDSTLAERFLNLIYATDENNKPYVNFIKSEKDDDNRLDEDHKVYIYYNNTARDARSLIHEMFHKFNEISLIVEDKLCYSIANRSYTETVSILAESLLVDYMYTLELINDYEYAMLKNERIENSKLAAKILIIEKELLEIKKKKN